MRLFATAPLGVENLLAAELQGFGAGDVRETKAGVAFAGDLGVAYTACLWSRVASRILMPIDEFPVHSPDDLYTGVRATDWRQHLTPDSTFAVDFSSTGSAIAHTQFGAQRAKDAIADQFRDRGGRRPSVDRACPDVRINIHARGDRAVLSIDLSGESLHRRTYRTHTTVAPLRENLAAAILLRAGWPRMAAEGLAFLDPMCGSGTFPIEAALIAGDIAPGVRREYFGFLRWRQHDAALWQRLLLDAHARAEQGMARLPPIAGCDGHSSAVRSARQNLARAGLEGRVTLAQADVRDSFPPGGAEGGLLVVNPPYGERLGSREDLRPVYAALGSVLRERFEGWTAWLLTGSEELAFATGLRAERAYTLYNSNVRCRLLKFPIAKRFRTTY